jgi:hypothetical protein
MRRFGLFFSLVLVFGLARSTAQSQVLSGCAPQSLNLSTPKGMSLQIQNFLFSSTIRSFGTLKVTNTGEAGIQGFLIIAELYGENGGYLLSIPFFSSNIQSQAFPAGSIGRRWLELHQSNSEIPELLTGRETELKGGSDNALLTCPATARLSYLELVYSGDIRVRAADPDLRTEPYIARIKDIKFNTMTGRRVKTGFSTLHVRQDGRAEFHPDNSGLRRRLAENITVLPATIGGVAMDSVLPVLIHRQPAEDALKIDREGHSLVAILTAYQKPEGGVIFYYGGVPAGDETLRTAR